MFDFSGKVVLITGAAGNLGGAVAGAFLAAGASLALADRSLERLAQRYLELAGDPGHLLLGEVDLTDPVSTEAGVARVVERFGRIDVLVNTVGGFHSSRLEETSSEDWDAMLNLNARTAFLISRAALPHMIRQGSGKVIHVAARAGNAGAARMAAYTASKAAVIRLTESLALEVRDLGINVNCVLPGTIDTPQNRQAMPKADFSRWVAPEALADAILFLASDAARAVNGAALPVFGQS
jgi:NAD(P)-dependent dehydrogenase (short-subunit alcohol dehydrogenase family)